MNVSEEDKADLAAGKVDYMAFSYYNSSCIMTHEVDATVKGNMMGGIKNPYLDASEWGWQIDPVGFKRALHELYDRYQLPLLVIENGLGAQDTLEADGTNHDPYRVDYMKRHIAAMKEAAEEGVDLMGYTMWSCIDLVSAGSGDHVGHQLGREGIAGLGRAILTGIAEIRDDGGNTAGRGAAQRVDHHQQLHQVVIDGLAGGLDYEHVAAADGLVQGDGDLAVSEALDLGFTQLGAHHLADLSRQRPVCVTAENFDVLPVRNHRNFPLFSVYFIYSKFQNYDSCSIFAKTGSSSAMVSGPKIGSQPDTSEAPDTALVILFFQTSRSSRPGAE